VESFPLTSNGKVDGQQLLANTTSPDADHTDTSQPSHAGATTRALRELWSRHTGNPVSGGGDHVSFFDAG